ncbi:UNVERIFIED_CONTAM: hypothetical protein FKN15_074599 [Acipenser sinensis]
MNTAIDKEDKENIIMYQSDDKNRFNMPSHFNLECIDKKRKENKSVRWCLSLVIVYLVLLTAGNGLMAYKGIAGPKGGTGIKGETGLPGLNGIKGEIGNQGAPGVNGKDGLQGAQGEKGEKGINGDTGPNGIPGKKFKLSQTLHPDGEVFL